jgi:hypothetical protein
MEKQGNTDVHLRTDIPQRDNADNPVQETVSVCRIKCQIDGFAGANRERVVLFPVAPDQNTNGNVKT